MCTNFFVLLLIYATTFLAGTAVTYGVRHLHRDIGDWLGTMLLYGWLLCLTLLLVAIVDARDPTSRFCQQDFLTGKPRVEKQQ